MPLIKIEDNKIKILESTGLKKISFNKNTLYYWGNIYRDDKNLILMLKKGVFRSIISDISGVFVNSENIFILRSFPGTIPLFYSYKKKTFLISDKYSNFKDIKIRVTFKSYMYTKNKNNNIQYKKTLYKGIFRFKPGYALDIKDNKTIKIYKLNKNKNLCDLENIFKNSVLRRTKDKNGIFLSEGMDSGAIYKYIDKTVTKSLSVILNEEGKTIIHDRIKNNNAFIDEVMTKKAKHIKMSVNYPFEPGIEIFRNCLNNIDTGTENVFFGIGGDDLCCSDILENLLREYLFRFKLKKIYIKRWWIKRLKNTPLKNFRGSFLKGALLFHLKSREFSIILENIYSVCSEYNVIPVYPFLDIYMIDYVLNLNWYDITCFSKERKEVKKNIFKIFSKKSLKLSFDKTFNNYYKNLFEKKYGINYNLNNNKSIYKVWKDETKL